MDRKDAKEQLCHIISEGPGEPIHILGAAVMYMCVTGNAQERKLAEATDEFIKGWMNANAETLNVTIH